jgi:hypothetical protein
LPAMKSSTNIYINIILVTTLSFNTSAMHFKPKAAPMTSKNSYPPSAQ